MRSKKQILASRANGARSRGPVTKEEKRRSSQNALRHGLLADCVVLCNESRAGFEETFQQYIDRFQPVDEIEFTFVEEMAVNYWRLRRAWSIETKMFDERIGVNSGDPMAKVAHSMEDLAGAQTLTLLNRYETRIHCAFQRALRNLLMLPSRQEPNEPKKPGATQPPAGPRDLPNEPRTPNPIAAGPQQTSSAESPNEPKPHLSSNPIRPATAQTPEAALVVESPNEPETPPDEANQGAADLSGGDSLPAEGSPEISDAEPPDDFLTLLLELPGDVHAGWRTTS
jgi:hypothetical protein